MMDEKLLERMLNNLIEEAGPIAINNMVKDDLTNLDDPNIEFSKDHEEKMKMIFAEARKGKVPSTIKPKKKITFKKIAIIAATLILISGAMIGTVGAWRESFVSYFLDDKGEYSDVDKRIEDKTLLVGNVYFGYVPAGFKYESEKEFLSGIMINFSSGDKYFALEMRENKWNNKVNTENGELNDAIINDLDMAYSENETGRYLDWKQNGYRCFIHTNVSKEMLFKIAENIKIVEE